MTSREHLINGIRKKLEIDFVCNKNSRRYYIQCAYEIPDHAKMEQEQRSLMLTGDFFKKIIIAKDAPAPYYNDDRGQPERTGRGTAGLNHRADKSRRGSD